jgi:hypothetical protein
VTILHIHLPLRAAVSAYEGCAADIYRVFGGTWLIGCVLMALYLGALVSGLLIGSVVYEILLGPFARFPHSPLNRTLDVAILLLLLYLASSLMCMMARALVRGITYLCYEMRGDVLFYSLVIITGITVALVIGSGVFSPVVAKRTLETVAGVSVVGALFFGTLTAWLYVRYRWPSNPRGRVFDRDIGLAWSHMSDPRRGRFGFDQH